MHRVLLVGGWVALGLAAPLPTASISEPRALQRVAIPEYSDIAIQANAGGLVVVHATVDGSGRVAAVTADGSQLLVNSAIQAARRWRFSETGGPRELVDVEVFYELVPLEACTANVLSAFVVPRRVEVRARRQWVDQPCTNCVHYAKPTPEPCE